jgi:transcriptional regulator with XRE-family HTH domain
MNGRRLQQLRLASNLSLEDLAILMVDSNKASYFKIEHGKANPTPTVLTKIGSVLGSCVIFLYRAICKS